MTKISFSTTVAAQAFRLFSRMLALMEIQGILARSAAVTPDRSATVTCVQAPHDPYGRFVDLVFLTFDVIVVFSPKSVKRCQELLQLRISTCLLVLSPKLSMDNYCVACMIERHVVGTYQAGQWWGTQTRKGDQSNIPSLPTRHPWEVATKERSE
mmetsp:Transcript_14441/g.33354  ORF Transcript_14441/g.33354 Transcript_14441/m.33354 type:complete len:155 (+) Transcript_14441:246-710(+)